MLNSCVKMEIVFPHPGFVMGSTIVLTELTKILIFVHCVPFNSCVQMRDVQTWRVFATERIIAKIIVMKTKSVSVSQLVVHISYASDVPIL